MTTGSLKAATASLVLWPEDEWKTIPDVPVLYSFGILRDKVDLPDPERAYEYYRTIGSGSRIPNCLDKNELTMAGMIPFTVQHGIPFVFGLGQCANTGSSSPWTHTIKTAEVLPSFGIQAGIGDGTSDFYRQYLGCKVNRMTIEGTEKGVVKGSLDILAGYTEIPLSEIDVSGVQMALCSPYQFHHTSANLKLGEYEVARLKSWRLTVDNKLESRYYWQDTDAHFPYEHEEFEQEIELTATLSPYDLTLWENLLAEDEIGFSFEITRISTDPNGVLSFTDATLTGFIVKAPHPLPERGPMETDITMKLFGLEIVVTDGIETYPEGNPEVL